MNDLTQLDLHYLTLRQALARVKQAYLDAIVDGVEEPTILVLDLFDEHARAIAELDLDPDISRGMIARAHHLQKRPSLVLPMSRPEAIATVAIFYPEMGPALAASHDSEVYLAVVIAFGGGQIFVLRRPAHGIDRRRGSAASGELKKFGQRNRSQSSPRPASPMEFDLDDLHGE